VDLNQDDVRATPQDQKVVNRLMEELVETMMMMMMMMMMCVF
jgi:hypothetical protein